MPTPRNQKRNQGLSQAEQDEIYDAALDFAKALGASIFVALGITLGWNLATPLTHMPEISPFSVWGSYVFIDFLLLAIKKWVKAK